MTSSSQSDFKKNDEQEVLSIIATAMAARSAYFTGLAIMLGLEVSGFKKDKLTAQARMARKSRGGTGSRV